MKLRETLTRDILGRRYAARGVMYLARKVYAGRPIPWGVIRMARGLTRIQDSLMGDAKMPVLDVAKLNNPAWRDLLSASGRAFDEWSFNEESLNLMERYLRAKRPRYALEFGCGLSTFCTASVLNELWGPDGDWMLFGVEQDAQHAAWVTDTLKRFGLDTHVRILVAPLARRQIQGQDLTCYDIGADDMAKLLGNARPSFVLIDGPFGQGPVRLPTLTVVRPFLAQDAMVLLDDALRDNELGILRAWERELKVRVTGIHPVRWGLAEIAA